MELKYADLTEKIIGCAMKVHRHIGPGFPEIIYQRCLLIELDKLGLHYLNEQEKSIYYEGQFVGKRRLDILVENKVLTELKAVTVIDNACYNQELNYLRVLDIEVGLLLNFGNTSLQFKKLINTNFKNKN